MNYEINQEIWVKIPHEIDGWHLGYVVGFTAKMIKVERDDNGVIGNYLAKNVKPK
tara:strand:- start:3737 stop:3901 length:165 start_codon:yes stop_codon:yes gene_type:complete